MEHKIIASMWGQFRNCVTFLNNYFFTGITNQFKINKKLAHFN